MISTPWPGGSRPSSAAIERDAENASVAPLDSLAPRGQAARRRAHRRVVAGRLRRRPARRDDAAGSAADLRGPRPFLRPDLPDLRTARAGAGCPAPARGPEHEGGPAARADLRRRQDPHAGRAAPPRARSAVAAEPACGGAESPARPGSGRCRRDCVAAKWSRRSALPRPDRTVRTWWRTPVDEAARSGPAPHRVSPTARCVSSPCWRRSSRTIRPGSVATP